jgi:hypothetical protein
MSRRFAVVSSPRSGSTLLRRLISGALGVPELAAHTPYDVPWATLPAEVILHLHWRRHVTFVERLRHEGMNVVTISRHPLDVLLSVLRFARDEPSTARWLGGENGDERHILGATPTSDSFIAYATGPRAASLLAVTAEWWEADDVVRVRYEDLVNDPVGTLAGAELPNRAAVADVVADSSSISETFPNHVRTPTPGTWRSVLPARHARTIADAHRYVFETLGYSCEPDERLEPAAAAARWAAIVGT